MEETFACSKCYKEFTRKDHTVNATKKDVRSETRHHHARERHQVHQRLHQRRNNQSPRSHHRARANSAQSTSEEPAILPEDADTREVYLEHWDAIRTRSSVDNRVQDRYNFTLNDLNIHQFRDMAREIFHQQRTAFKINLSFGFILRNIETGELRYYHSSQNNNRFFDVPHLIRNEDDLERFLDKELDRQDLLEYIRQQRPDTKWVVHLITNVTYYVNKLVNHPIGAPVVLPPVHSSQRRCKWIGKVSSHGQYDDQFMLFPMFGRPPWCTS